MCIRDRHDRECQSVDIKKALMNVGVIEEDIVIYPNQSYSKDDPTYQLTKYLNDPKGVFITNQNFFVGMEASSMVYCFGGNTSNIRCHLMRAVENLCVLQLILKLEISPREFTLDGTNLCLKFIDCAKSLKGNVSVCETCSNNQKLNHSKDKDIGKEETEETSSKIHKLKKKFEQFEMAQTNSDEMNSNQVIVCRPCQIAWLRGHVVTRMLIKNADCICNKISQCLFAK